MSPELCAAWPDRFIARMRLSPHPAAIVVSTRVHEGPTLVRASSLRALGTLDWVVAGVYDIRKPAFSRESMVKDVEEAIAEARATRLMFRSLSRMSRGDIADV